MEKQKLLLIFLISNLQFLLSTATDYCVIGAGPSGLQMGYFLERAGRDYVIFERDTSAGWFYKKYPRHRTLISINKRFTGQTNKEFNMRHDWNSLISDDESLLLKHYTKEFFPPADKMVEYLRDFATRLNLKAKYGVNIRRVVKHPENDTFTLYDKKTNPYQCKYLIVSTGLWVENNPKNISGIENTVSYSKMSVNADDYEGKSVFIIGRGNSAFETAQHLAGAANYIHMMSRERARFSWETHYVGDLRAVNDGPIDTYQLKSLDGQFEGDIRHMNFNKNKEGKIQVGGSGEPDNSAVREPYDVIIRCMGFKFDFGIFDKPVRPKRADGPRKKYPMIHHNYESTVTKNIFFAGTITHSLDWRKSAGGFIHGFRYTTRALHHLLEYRNHGVKWPHLTLRNTELLNTLTKRLNEASGIYQMFGVLVDVIVLQDDGQFQYFEEFPKGLIPEFQKHTGVPFKRGIVLNLEYGKNFSGPGSDPFKEERAVGEVVDAHLSNFLHPVLYYYSSPVTNLTSEGDLPRPDFLHHILEDFLAMWDALLHHHLPLRWFLEKAVGEDLRHFFAEDCLQIAMISKNLPIYCREHYLKGSMLDRPSETHDQLVLELQAKASEAA
ncbi:FAD-dependent oxidoreductase domain-containing protein 2-like isoform X3 [Rhopilema esculentum]